MTETPATALALLRDAEHYLSALHGSVARHDNLGVNLTCAGCSLRAVIAGTLPTLAVAPVSSPPADQTALRDRIAAALREHYLSTNRDDADADRNMPCRCGDWREPGAEADDENDWDAHLAEVALTSLPAPLDRAEYDAVVDEADRLRREGAALHARAERIDKQLTALRKQVAAPIDETALESLSDTLYDALYAITPFAEQHFADEQEGLRNAVRAVLKQAAVLPTTNHDTDTSAELTAEEARALADDLGLQLYEAQDAVAFVAECCTIAEREQRAITTADVREWLKGARCGRQLAAAVLRCVADETAATEHCPTPETHNWGCGCTTDEHPAALGTLPAWLYQRFMAHGVGWDNLDDDDRSYWEHQARAVRRAVARGGFKQPATGARQDEAQPCPAKHGALGRICELHEGHPGMHTGSGPNGAAVWDGDAP
ncbi:hypothetical protein [Streptomyces sp. NPDC004250]|uniref:hypothetical protein n=1 Tax=Streptomyces sp. NPDC004250 TaxID=3364692 RepID=UPI0036740763